MKVFRDSEDSISQRNEKDGGKSTSQDLSNTQQDTGSNDNVTSTKSKCNGEKEPESNSGGLEKDADSMTGNGETVQSRSNSEQTDMKVSERDQSNNEDTNAKVSGSDHSNIEDADTKVSGWDQTKIENAPTTEQTLQSQDLLSDKGYELVPRVEEASSTTAEVDKKLDYLSQLPFELLRYLARFLDSFTINHLAMTSKLLRQVCCSLLEERGMVVLQWEKQRGRWKTTMKV